MESLMKDTANEPSLLSNSTNTKTKSNLSDDQSLGPSSAAPANLADTTVPLESRTPPLPSKPQGSTGCLENDVIDTLFENLPVLLQQHGDKDLVDMNDNRITELWHSMHGPASETKRKIDSPSIESQPKRVKVESSNLKLPTESKAKARVETIGSESSMCGFRHCLQHRNFVAKSA
jgi:cell division septation protein DedD